MICFSKSLDALKMFLKQVLLTCKQNNVQKGFLRVLSNVGSSKNSSISNGILYSDSDDIVVPSASLTEILFERFTPFQKYTAIVSIFTFSYHLQNIWDRIVHFLCKL